MKNLSQKERILTLLKAVGIGVWVPLTAILDLRIAQYNARIFELKDDLALLGLTIQNRTEWRHGVQHSEFRLVATTSTAPFLAPKNEDPVASPTPELPHTKSGGDPRFLVATSPNLRAPATVNSPDPSASDAAVTDEDRQEGTRCPTNSLATYGHGQMARAAARGAERSHPAIQLPLL